ncbi:hypothetical protein D3C81_1944190 [compost metagenome]
MQSTSDLSGTLARTGQLQNLAFPGGQRILLPKAAEDQLGRNLPVTAHDPADGLCQLVYRLIFEQVTLNPRLHAPLKITRPRKGG